MPELLDSLLTKKSSSLIFESGKIDPRSSAVIGERVK